MHYHSDDSPVCYLRARLGDLLVELEDAEQGLHVVALGVVQAGGGGAVEGDERDAAPVLLVQVPHQARRDLVAVHHHVVQAGQTGTVRRARAWQVKSGVFMSRLTKTPLLSHRSTRVVSDASHVCLGEPREAPTEQPCHEQRGQRRGLGSGERAEDGSTEQQTRVQRRRWEVIHKIEKGRAVQKRERRRTCWWWRWKRVVLVPPRDFHGRTVVGFALDELQQGPVHPLQVALAHDAPQGVQPPTDVLRCTKSIPTERLEEPNGHRANKIEGTVEME